MKVDVKLPTDLMQQLQHLSDNIEDIEGKMLDNATDVLKPEIEKNLKQAITGKYATGELESSVAVKKKRTAKEKSNTVYFKGTTIRQFKNGKTQKVRNGLKATILEYGKNGQPPRPFVRPAMNAKRAEMIRVMEEIFDREVLNKCK